MTSAALKNTPAVISIKAAWMAIGAMSVYYIILIVLIFLRPDLDPSWHTISEWAIGPYGWLMSAGFLISALSYAALFAMLKPQVRGMLGRSGLAILLICAIGATGVGIFTTDPMPLHPPLSMRGTLHVIFGTGQLVLLPFAALFINISLARGNEAWRVARPVLAGTAALPLFGFVSFAVYSHIRVSVGARRLWPRRQHWLASAIRVFYLHAMGHDLRLASDQMRP